MTSGGESERLFEAYWIPSPARPLFQTAFGNLNRRSPIAMDTQNPDRGPQRLISCQKTTWWPPDRIDVGGPRCLAAAAGSDRNRCPPTIGHYQRRQVATGVPLRHPAQADPNGSPGARRDCP